MASAPGPPARAAGWWSRTWAPLLIATLLLGPVLFVPGYLLTYDMVWVPDLAMRGDFFGLGSGIPRAVPSDAWVAVLDEVVPGMVLQRLVLLGALVAGGVGIQRWVDDDRVTFGSTAAAAFYLWNPYVVERLAIGHWPMLLCYGLLPWVARAVARSASTGRLAPSLLALVPLASLNASAGLAAAVVVIAFAVRAVTPAMAVRLGGVVAVANLPWIAAGLAKAGVLQGAAVAAAVFAPAKEGSLPAPLATLTLGGIWNAETVPASRTTFLAWVALVVVLAALVFGRKPLRERAVRGWWWCAAIGWGLAVLGWAAPGAIDHLAAAVPGAGLLRDGSRLLVLLAPLLAIAIGAATDRVVTTLGEGGTIAGTFLILLPLALLPDAAWGMTGDLRPVSYPDSYADMRAAVAEANSTGDVLVLPFTSYRAPEWNHARKVLDPVGRYQDEDYLASDTLSVSGREVSSEDQRSDDVVAALQHSEADERARALADIGVGVVVTDKITAALPGQQEHVAEVAGRVVADTSDFAVVALADVTSPRTSPALRLGLGVAWLLWVAQQLAGLGLCAAAWRARRRVARGG